MPPMKGARIGPIDSTMPISASMRAAASRSCMSRTMARASTGAAIEPNTWRKRARISCSIDCAKRQPTEATT
jgi:hypothetical protein